MNYFKILIISLLFLSSSQLFGQSYIGFFGGINSGKFSGDPLGDFKYSSNTNFTLGLAYDFQLKEDIYLSVLPAYVNGSSKLQHPKEVDEEEVLVDSISLDFQMVSLPIVMKIISDNKKFQFSGGLEFMFPLVLVADNSAEETDLINRINKASLSALFGIGYRIPIKKSLLNINLTYSQGLTNIANNLDDPDALLPRIRFTSFRLTAGWYLPVGKNKFNQSSAN
jgi:hypothetical protein